MLLHLEALTLRLQRLELVLQRHEVFLEFINHFFSDFAEELALLSRYRSLDLHLAKFFLQ